MKSGAVERLPARGPRVVLPDEEDEHGKADHEVDERHADAPEREQRPREVDLRDEREVRQQAEAREAEGGGEVLHRQHACDDEAGIRRRARREVRELAEDDHVDQRRERRDEDRPRDTEERLLVADGDVAPDERPEELAVVPELADVEAREAGSPAGSPSRGSRASASTRRPGSTEDRCRVEASTAPTGRALLLERRLGSTPPRDASGVDGPSRPRRASAHGPCSSTPGCSSVSASPASVVDRDEGRPARRGSGRGCRSASARRATTRKPRTGFGDATSGGSTWPAE